MVLGAKHVETPYIELGQICTFLYFSYFLLLIPVTSLFENVASELNLNKGSENSLVRGNSKPLPFKASRPRDAHYSTKRMYSTLHVPPAVLRGLKVFGDGGDFTSDFPLNSSLGDDTFSSAMQAEIICESDRGLSH
jgi:hypothetical protein